MATKEIVNAHGFVDFVLVEDEQTEKLTTHKQTGTYVTVCPSCEVLVHENKGQGTLCTGCQESFDSECDTDEGILCF